MRGFIVVRKDAELRGSDSVMQAAMCSCELQIQWQGGTWVQAPISVVATISHTTPPLTRSRGGPATGRCGGHAQVSRQAKHYAHRGINALMSCDKAFQDPCHSVTRERKYVQQHIRICTHGVKTGLG